MKEGDGIDKEREKRRQYKFETTAKYVSARDLNHQTHINSFSTWKLIPNYAISYKSKQLGVIDTSVGHR